MQIKYISDDGREFQNELECLEYEKDLQKAQFNDTLFLFDDDGNRVKIEKFEQVYFINAKTDEAAQFLHDEWNGYYLTPWTHKNIPKAGCYLFYEDDWHTLEEYLKRIELIDKIFEMKN